MPDVTDVADVVDVVELVETVEPSLQQMDKDLEADATDIKPVPQRRRLTWRLCLHLAMCLESGSGTIPAATATSELEAAARPGKEGGGRR